MRRGRNGVDDAASSDLDAEQVSFSMLRFSCHPRWTWNLSYTRNICITILREFEINYRLSYHCSLLAAKDRKRILNLKNQVLQRSHELVQMEPLQMFFLLQNRGISFNFVLYLDFIDIFNLHCGISFNLNVVNIVNLHGWIAFNLDFCQYT